MDRDESIGAVTPLEKLREHMTSLEAEIARVERQRAELRAHDMPFELQAMEAIRAGDDHAAKVALSQLRLSEHADGSLQADLTVLRGLLDACRDFLVAIAKAPGDAPP